MSTTGSTQKIVVLRQGTHGLSPQTYGEAIRERLPNHEISVARTPAEERELVEDATIISSVDVHQSLLEHASDLRMFAGIAAGYDHLPLDYLRDRDIAVTNASGIHAPNIAEQVLGYVLTFTRRLDEGWRRQQRSEWRHYQAHELKGSTVTVVGLGSIGTAVVDRLEGFDVDTIGVRYTPEKGGPCDEIVGFDDGLDEELARTDYLVIASPLTETTRGLLDNDALETLPQHSVVVNVGRGPIIDTDAPVEAIQTNAVRGAALDVTDPEPLPRDHPLWSFENVLITPHNAGHTPKHWSRLAEILARNVEHGVETGRFTGLENQVVTPDS